MDAWTRFNESIEEDWDSQDNGLYDGDIEDYHDMRYDYYSDEEMAKAGYEKLGTRAHQYGDEAPYANDEFRKTGSSRIITRKYHPEFYNYDLDYKYDEDFAADTADLMGVDYADQQPSGRGAPGWDTNTRTMRNSDREEPVGEPWNLPNEDGYWWGNRNEDNKLLDEEGYPEEVDYDPFEE